MTVADRSIQRGVVGMSLAGVVLAVGVSVVSGVRSGGGVLVGTAVAIANLIAYAWVVRRLLATGGAGFALLFFLKLFGLFAVVGLLLAADIVRALPFAFGYAALPLGLVLASLTEKTPEKAAVPRGSPRTPSDDDA